MCLYIRPLNFRWLFIANAGTAVKSADIASGMDCISRLLLPSAVVYTTLFSNFSLREKMTLSTAVAGAHLFTSLDKKAISYIARGTLLTTSYFWWKQGNYPLAIGSFFLSTFSCIITECIYKPGEASEDRLRCVYAFALPILWNLARTMLTPVKQAALFAALPLVFSVVEHKTTVVSDDNDYKSYYVINLGIATAGVFFSAMSAIRSASSFDRSALVSIALLNTAHIGLIVFGHGKRS